MRSSFLAVLAVSVAALALLTWAFLTPPAAADQDRAPADPDSQPSGAQIQPSPQEASAVPSYVLDHAMRTIAGEPARLDAYKGKVLLMVNVASKCGLTPQYEALEALYREHKDAGFVVLGFPANNFGGQEPGTNEQIAAFCSDRYDVSFPMFEKISVLGEDRHPLYAQLAALPEPLGGDPKWNFTKFLVNRSGEVVARFEPRTAPNDPAMLEALAKLLAEPGPSAPAGS